jgi:hypothetical protein
MRESVAAARLRNRGMRADAGGAATFVCLPMRRIRAVAHGRADGA